MNRDFICVFVMQQNHFTTAREKGVYMVYWNDCYLSLSLLNFCFHFEGDSMQIHTTDEPSKQDHQGEERMLSIMISITILTIFLFLMLYK